MAILSKYTCIATAFLMLAPPAHPASPERENLEQIVNGAVQPVLEAHEVPGMVVGLTIDGERYFFEYGVASKESGRRATKDTFFEIGSISKAFTASLAAYAQESGSLSLTDKASRYLPALEGSNLDRVSLLDLGTYSAGGLPLQFPDHVTDQEELVKFYRSWRPEYEPGTHRLYSNPSIGLFGFLAARSLGKSFDEVMESLLLPKLGLEDTFIDIPDHRIGDYAFGYTKNGNPIRVSPGMFDSEAYGIKTTAADMLQFLEANMGQQELEDDLSQALATTRTGYFKVGDMVQGLGWEIYQWPIELDRLLDGNSAKMAFKPHKVTKLDPPKPLPGQILVNKTGSTNGFGAYVAFLPGSRIGLVMLANKNYPIPERVRIAYEIMTALED
nr:class C beta-lactamase [Rhizobium sp. Q54]